MNDNEKVSFPIPGFLPSALQELDEKLPDRILGLYQQLAKAAEGKKQLEEWANKEVDSQRREIRAIIGILATEKWNFTQVLGRLLVEKEQAISEKGLKILHLFEKSWAQNHKRMEIEITDFAGQTLTDEVLDMVDVVKAIPELLLKESSIRETLTPLVSWQGQIVQRSKVITSVPFSDSEKMKEKT